MRAFTFGHVRQLDRVLDRVAGTRVGDGRGARRAPFVIDIDSFIGEVYGDQKQGAAYGYTRQLGYHPILATRTDTARCCISATARARRTPSAGSPVRR